MWNHIVIGRQEFHVIVPGRNSPHEVLLGFQSSCLPKSPKDPCLAILESSLPVPSPPTPPPLIYISVFPKRKLSFLPPQNSAIFFFHKKKIKIQPLNKSTTFFFHTKKNYHSLFLPFLFTPSYFLFSLPFLLLMSKFLLKIPSSSLWMETFACSLCEPSPFPFVVDPPMEIIYVMS